MKNANMVTLRTSALFRPVEYANISTFTCLTKTISSVGVVAHSAVSLANFLCEKCAQGEWNIKVKNSLSKTPKIIYSYYDSEKIICNFTWNLFSRMKLLFFCHAKAQSSCGNTLIKGSGVCHVMRQVVLLHRHYSFTYMLVSNTVPSHGGGILWAQTSKKASSPQNKIWSAKNQWIFCQSVFCNFLQFSDRAIGYLALLPRITSSNHFYSFVV